MFEEMVLAHSILIKIMLAVLVVGAVIPFLSKNCANTIKKLRIYMFVSHGMLTMIAFSGLVAFVFADMAMSLDIIIMIVAFLAMIMIEVLKYKRALKTRENREECRANIRKNVLIFTLLNIAILAGLVVYKIIEAKSAVPIS